MAVVLSALMVSAVDGAAADGPLYSLDVMTQHPYRFTPAWGHASQNPGSPRWFVPGYGYQIPGFGYGLNRYSALSPYQAHYAFGIRQPAAYSDATHQNWSSISTIPWFLPGSSTNTQLRTFAW